MMAKKNKGLGRGLDALLMPEPTPVATPAEGLQTIAVSLLQAGKYQPRRRFDDSALAELSTSIKSQGIMQPIVVRKLEGSERFEIIAGERRFRAAQLAGLTEVPTLVKVVDDRTALTLSLVENLQRQDLNAIEEAHGLQRLIAEFGFTHEQAADAVGKSRSAVSNLLRLLDLATPVQDRVVQGTLEMGHARALTTLPKDQQVMLAERIAIQGLSVRATEALVKEESEAAGKGVNAGRKKVAKGSSVTVDEIVNNDPDLNRLETELADSLGTYVEIRHTKEGRGELVLRYADLEQLDGILARLKMPA